MTESEWWACRNPYDLLSHVEGRVSGRKLRLFAGAVCRCAGEEAVAAVVERYADGEAGREELKSAAASAEQRWRRAHRVVGYPYAKRRMSSAGRRGSPGRRPTSAPSGALGAMRESVFDLREQQCAILHELVGDPFAPVTVRGEWLAWENGIVRRMALAMYEEKAFDRLPLLADALMDADCRCEALLHHLREPGQHWRGCWALDLLLGRS